MCRSIKKILLFVAIMVCQNAYSQRTDFWLTQKFENADWYQERILNMDEYMDSTDTDFNSVFAVHPGTYDILFFQRYVYWESVSGYYDFCEHIIIVKVNKAKEIPEAYFVPYGWAEYPISMMIDKSDGGMKLKNRLDVRAMKFRHLDKNLNRNLLKENPGINTILLHLLQVNGYLEVLGVDFLEKA